MNEQELNCNRENATEETAIKVNASSQDSTMEESATDRTLHKEEGGKSNTAQDESAAADEDHDDEEAEKKEEVKDAGRKRSRSDGGIENESENSSNDREPPSERAGEDNSITVSDEVENIEGDGNEDEDEEDGSESESESDDEEEEDEDEPKLKYHRLSAGVFDLLKRDSASTMTVSEKFVALGTHCGMIHILDFDGNETKRFRSHSATINHLSIDDAGEYVASASDDGKVVINGLYVAEAVAFNYRRPVKCVAIDPEYSRKSARSFVSGGLAGQLILNDKGWFSNKDTVLHAGEGPIITVKWRKNLIAWSSDTGVRIYDTVAKQRITYIDRPDGSPRPDLYECRLCWKSDDTLLIGWANCVKVARMKERVQNQGVTAELPTLHVEIVHMFMTDCIVSGISPFGEMLLILAYPIDQFIENEATDDISEQRRKVAERPELRVTDERGTDISRDALSLIEFENCQANDYVLESLSSQDLFYVLSPKDLVVSRPRDADDHVAWLVEHLKYEEALAAIETASSQNVPLNSDRGHTVKAVGHRYLLFLMENQQYEKAAEICPRVLGGDAQSWENWVFKFAEMRQLKVIAPKIPTTDLQLTSTVYEMILAYFLSTDYLALLSTIKQWPPGLYNPQTVIKAVKDRLSDLEATTPVTEHHSSLPTDDKTTKKRQLMEALADLYTAAGRPDMSLEHHLRLGTPNTIDLIREHNLLSEIKDKIIVLMEFDEQWESNKKIEEPNPDTPNLKNRKGIGSFGSLLCRQWVKRGPAVELLVTNTDSIPVSTVVDQLFSKPALLHIYLDTLFDREPALGSKYHDLQVELYAEFDREKLLNFLRASNYYSLEKSYAICEQRDFVPEMVFILGRMGNNKRALSLIIERLGDVERAIEFAKEQDDEDLWEDLVAYSLDKPDFVKGLLENVATHIDPVKLISRVPEDMEIPGLKESMLKILFDHNLQSSLLQGSQRILVSDSVLLADRLHGAQKRGLLCIDIATCAQCLDPLFTPGNQISTTVNFFCKHAYHNTCLVNCPPESPSDLDATAATLSLSSSSAKSTIISVSMKIDQSRSLRSRGATCPICREAQSQLEADADRIGDPRLSAF